VDARAEKAQGSIADKAMKERRDKGDGMGEIVLMIRRYCNNPKTATPVGVPTNTFPFTTIGTMNLLPLPK
jgi:hypothetical protein